MSLEPIAVLRCEDSLELDLFLLQCCAVISPCENFVERVIARFSLTDYFNHSLWHPNEYDLLFCQYVCFTDQDRVEYDLTRLVFPLVSDIR